MSRFPKPPKQHAQFVTRYPKLGEAWELIHSAGEDGPLDDKTARLVRLAVAIGAQREGAVHASVRKGLAQGLTRRQMEQVVALAAGTIGFPAAVAAYYWLKDVPGKR